MQFESVDSTQFKTTTFFSFLALAVCHASFVRSRRKGSLSEQFTPKLVWVYTVFPVTPLKLFNTKVLQVHWNFAMAFHKPFWKSQGKELNKSGTFVAPGLSLFSHDIAGQFFCIAPTKTLHQNYGKRMGWYPKLSLALLYATSSVFWASCWTTSQRLRGSQLNTETLAGDTEASSKPLWHGFLKARDHRSQRFPWTCLETTLYRLGLGELHPGQLEFVTPHSLGCYFYRYIFLKFHNISIDILYAISKLMASKGTELRQVCTARNFLRIGENKEQLDVLNNPNSSGNCSAALCVRRAIHQRRDLTSEALNRVPSSQNLSV